MAFLWRLNKLPIFSQEVEHDNLREESMKLKGKQLLLTGATGGIGIAVARKLHRSGVSLVLSCLHESKLAELNAELGAEHNLISADVTSANGREALVKHCVKVGGIDGVINLAGVLDFGLFEQQSEAMLEKMLTVNLMSPMLLTQAMLPHLRTRDESVILNVGSIFASIGHPGFVAYCATKAGLMRFSESLNRELADSSVRVVYIAPRATNTPLNDDRVNSMNSELGVKSDSPEWVADQIVAMLSSSEASRYLGWPEKLFVKINALAPRVVASALAKNLSVIKSYAKRD